MINFVIMRPTEQSTETIHSVKKEDWYSGMPHKGDSIVINDMQHVVINILYILKSNRWEANVVLMTIDDFESQNNIIHRPTATVKKWSTD